MDKHTVRLYFGCGNERNFMTLSLENDEEVGRWTEYDLNRLTLKTDLITGIRVGPKTVVEVYSDPYLYTLRRKIINDSETRSKHLELGCFEDHSVWAGIIRSLRMVSYEYYKRSSGTRYCESDDQCRDNEYCLCKGGQKDKSWCPSSKRRCMHKSNLSHDRKRTIELSDLIDLNCMNSKFANYKAKNGKYISTMRDIHDMAIDCADYDLIDKSQPSWNKRQDLSLGYYIRQDRDIPPLGHQLSLLNGEDLYGNDGHIEEIKNNFIEGFGKINKSNDISCLIIIIMIAFIIYCIILFL